MELSKYVGSRIKRLRENRNMNQEELAEVFKTTKQSISRYETGERKANQDILFELSKFFNVELDYFFPKEGSKIRADTIYNYYPTTISAGLPDYIDGISEPERIEIPDDLMGKHAGQRDIFITRVNGNSMNRIIPDGSLIGVKPIEYHQLKDGDVVVYSDDGDYSVKRFYRNGSELIFKPDSTDARFYDYVTDTDNENLKIHGKVIVYIVTLD